MCIRLNARTKIIFPFDCPPSVRRAVEGSLKSRERDGMRHRRIPSLSIKTKIDRWLSDGW